MKTIIEQWLESQRETCIGILEDLVRFRTVNPKFSKSADRKETIKLQKYVQDFMIKHGMAVDYWEVEDDLPNVVGILKGESPSNSLILNGHIDVVPPGDLNKWSTNPWDPVIHGGKLYGRGSGDMKAGVAANLLVAKFIHDHQIYLENDLQIHVVVDEEGGGGGTKAVLEKYSNGGGVIVTEPTDNIINPTEGGLEWVRIHIEGVSSHAGWRYSDIYPGYKGEGVNAIEKAAKVIAAVQDLERTWARKKSHPLLPYGITTINPGVMIGGASKGQEGPEITTNPAITPDSCIIEFDLKFLPNENVKEVKEEFENFIKQVSLTDDWLRDHVPTIEWGIRGISFPPVDTSLDHPLVEACSSSHREFNIAPEFQGFVAVSDAAFYAGKGIPAIIYGPKSERIHGVNECVDIESYFQTIKVLIASTLKWNNKWGTTN